MCKPDSDVRGSDWQLHPLTSGIGSALIGDTAVIIEDNVKPIQPVIGVIEHLGEGLLWSYIAEPLPAAVKLQHGTRMKNLGVHIIVFWYGYGCSVVLVFPKNGECMFFRVCGEISEPASAFLAFIQRKDILCFASHIRCPKEHQQPCLGHLTDGIAL